MLTLKRNLKPEIEICKMNCDGGLSPHLNKWEMTEHLNKHQMTLMIGRPGSGKTSLIYSLFKSKGKNKILNGVFTTIYLYQPLNSRGSMTDNIFNDELPEDQKFDELNEENLSYVYDRIKQDATEGYTSCIIFDDMGAFLKNNEILKIFKEMFFNRRHLKLSCFFLCQTFYSFPKDLRRIWSNLFIFKVSKDEMSNIITELIEQQKDVCNEIMNLVYDKPFQYLMINVDSQKLYKGFDEIIINKQ